MLKKILIISIISILWCSSIAFAYVFGGSNLSLSMYPEFNSYLPYNPSKYEVELYVEEAKKYVENCNNDIQRIQEAQAAAIREANDAIYRYNNGF